ncbi:MULTISPECIES: hypothetical protein [Azotobacter]|nr:hypothetical protein [Azotobacter vinelandii]GLK61035.1 hypothetical protein GCM10017624_31980 [Azotobacter vinelandii]SFY31759.1 hypothetical protein SAMN04244547_05064 [Azotobacter vinelandii]
MQKTTLIDRFGNPLTPQTQLVVVAKLPNGSYAEEQALSSWQNGQRNTNLVAHAHGYDLLNILTNELGLVDIDSTELLQFRVVVTADPHVSVMRVLGKIAEAVIVQECNRNIFANRKWGMVARKGRRPHQALDDFKAIGTGLNSTQRHHPQKYNATNPQRDIIWIHKENTTQELLQLVRGNNSGVSAGIQVKVSHDGLMYLYQSDIVSRRYEVPLVYFDLGNDFHNLTNKIYAAQMNVAIGTDFVRGHTISPEIHDLLVSYYWLVYDLVAGRMRIDQLIKDELLFDAFKKDVQEQQLHKQIIVL